MSKRIFVASTIGFIFGVICYLIGVKILGYPFSNADIAATIYNRVLIGFFIGIITWKLNAYLGAAIIGFIISIHVGINIFSTTGLLPGISFCIVGALYAMAIEWLTSKLTSYSQENI